MLLYGIPVMGQTSIYDLKVHTAYGGEFALQQFKGRKILIAVVSFENLNKKKALQFLDSVRLANPKVAFILVPADDMDTLTNDSVEMVNLKTKSPKEFLVSDSGGVKKDKGERQHPLVRWLTDITQNQYFDGDVESDLQLYVISESGVLYAIMAKGVRMSMLNEVLQADDFKPSPFGLLKQ